MFIVKVTNKSTGNIQESEFKTEQERTYWIVHCESQELWGKLEHTIHHDEIPAIEAVLDEDGNIVQPKLEAEIAWDEVIPKEYDLELIEKEDPIAAISPRQIRLALLSLGVTEANVDGAIATLPSPEKDAAMIAWKFSTSFERSVPMVSAIGQMLGMNKEQLDSLWTMAGGL